IFNVRVNPDNADDTVSIRHPSGKIVIPNDNFGIISSSLAVRFITGLAFQRPGLYLADLIEFRS
ncbi:MAG: hypothetical protein L0Y35_01195, partial [Flammeovirgaceae bacterium]|nr:hypothetical protein [Flammeovirgaceae bacterium]